MAIFKDDLLVNSGDLSFGPRRVACNIKVSDRYVPVAWTQDPAQKLDQGRLTTRVRTDDTDDLTCIYP